VAQELIRRFVGDLTRTLDLPDPVVEFGSLQVEPGQDSDLRPLFAGSEFIGTDMRDGPGVDRVEDLRSLTFGDGEVGTALCLDTLEHCEDPPAACRELARVTATPGVCVLSSVMLFGVHAYPSDYFRFTPEGLRSLLSGFDHVRVAGIGDPDIPFQVVGVGLNGADPGLSLERLPSLAVAQEHWEAAEREIRIGPFRYPPGKLARELGGELRRHATRLWRSGR
jgi:hypothetical protein